MIAYSREEMVSVTDLLKSLRQTLDKISHRSVEKIAVMKNNRPEAVMLSVEEYERIKELADMAEQIGLAELIRERKAAPKASYIPFEDVMAHREQLLENAKKIAKSAKEEYDLLNG